MSRPYEIEWKPLERNFTDEKRRRTDGVILHVAAGEAHSQFGWFSNPKARASSHYYVRKDGSVEQYIDTDKISWCSKNGDQRCVSIETQGLAHDAWTDEQMHTLAHLCAELAGKYGFPLRKMQSSSRSERGVGYHSLGVPADYSQLNAQVSQTGGELWSGAVGKECPGPQRVQQVDDVIDRALQISKNGGDDEDMLKEEERNWLNKAATGADLNTYALNTFTIPLLKQIADKLDELSKKLDKEG